MKLKIIKMSEITNFLKHKRKSFFYWIQLIIANFKKSNKKVIDKSWAKLKIHHSIYPEGFNKESWNKFSAFKYLETEYSKENKTFKAYAD